MTTRWWWWRAIAEDRHDPDTSRPRGAQRPDAPPASRGRRRDLAPRSLRVRPGGAGGRRGRDGHGDAAVARGARPAARGLPDGRGAPLTYRELPAGMPLAV